MPVKKITASRPSGLTRGFTLVELLKSGQREEGTGSTAEDSRPAE